MSEEDAAFEEVWQILRAENYYQLGAWLTKHADSMKNNERFSRRYLMGEPGRKSVWTDNNSKEEA